MRQDIVAGLTLTGHFLETRVLIPRGEAMPEASMRLRELLERRVKST
jgi:DNA repair protein RecO (recombination protein O)